MWPDKTENKPPLLFRVVFWSVMFVIMFIAVLIGTIILGYIFPNAGRWGGLI